MVDPILVFFFCCLFGLQLIQPKDYGMSDRLLTGTFSGFFRGNFSADFSREISWKLLGNFSVHVGMQM